MGKKEVSSIQMLVHSQRDVKIKTLPLNREWETVILIIMLYIVTILHSNLQSQ